MYLTTGNRDVTLPSNNVKHSYNKPMRAYPNTYVW